MPTGRQPSPAALELVQRFEGYRRRAARLPNGGWTVGYGHTASARQGVEVSEADARDLLTWDLRRTAAAVDAHLYAPVTQNQFDALVAFAFNVGPDAFRGSAVLRRLNEGLPLQAASALEAWRRAEFEGEPQVIDALVRRRAAEKILFLTPEGGFVPAPGAVLRPQIDYAVPVPDERPLDLLTDLEGDDAVARPAAPRDDAPAPAPAERSATALAADAVADRLRSLLPSQPEPSFAAPGRGLSVDAAPEPASEPAAAPRAFAAPELDTGTADAVDSEPSPFPAEDSAPEEAPGAMAEPDAEIDPALSLAPPSPGYDAAASADDAPEPDLAPLPLDVPADPAPLLAETPEPDLAPVPELETEPEASGMAAVARRWPYLFLFIGGAFLFGAGVHALQQRDTPATFGWLFGLAGVACMLTAAYALFRRGEEEA